MRKLLLSLAFLTAFLPHLAYAQAIVLPCVPSGNSCIPVSAANPLPTTGGTATSIDAGGATAITNGQNGGVFFQNGASPTGTLSNSSSFAYTDPGQLSLALGTIATNLSAINITGTFNNGALVFDAPLSMNITNTASLGTSLIENLKVGGVTMFSVSVSGSVIAGQNMQVNNTGRYGWLGRSFMTSPADGQFKITANNGTTLLWDYGTTAASTLTVTGTLAVTTLANVATTSAVCYNTGTGLFTYDGTLGTCTVSALWHKNLLGVLARSDDPLSMLRSIVYTYRHNNDGIGDDRVHIGLAADDVALMDQRCVAYDTQGRLSNYEDRCVLAYLVEDRKHLRARIEALERTGAR